MGISADEVALDGCSLSSIQTWLQYTTEEAVCLQLIEAARTEYYHYRTKVMDADNENHNMSDRIAFLASAVAVDLFLKQNAGVMPPIAGFEAVEDKDGGRVVRFLGCDVYTFVDADVFSAHIFKLCKKYRADTTSVGYIDDLPVVYVGSETVMIAALSASGFVDYRGLRPVYLSYPLYPQEIVRQSDTSYVVLDNQIIDGDARSLDAYLESYRRV